MDRFVGKIHNHLRANGKILIAEPYFHVTSNKFVQELEVFKSSGFREVRKKNVFFSYATVLEKIQ
jgi:hypothetical protein